jgi:hypothetical protein
MVKEEEHASGSENDRADVVTLLSDRIRGIGARTAEAFYDLGVRNLADLHQYLIERTDEQVVTSLRERGARVFPDSIIEKYDWRGQVEKQAAECKATPVAADRAPDEEPSGSHRASRHDAAFSIFFDYITTEDGASVLQTTVYQENNYGEEAVFTGAETVPWLNWIIKQAKLPLVGEAMAEESDFQGQPGPAEEAPELPLPETPAQKRIEIQSLRTSPIEPSLGQPEKRLRAEVKFRIVGPEAESMTARGAVYRVEVHTLHKETGTPNLVASSHGRLKPNVRAYASRHEFGLPPLGRYDLYAIVLLLPPEEATAYYRGEPIRIVP